MYRTGSTGEEPQHCKLLIGREHDVIVQHDGYLKHNNTAAPFLKAEPMSENVVWSAEEVQTFLCIIGEEAVQRELNGAVRNEKVFQLVSAKMAESGFNWTASQCRRKLKKLRSDYRRIKDHNSQSGVARKHWRWFEQMDAIYSHRPASMGRGAGVDSARDLKHNNTATPFLKQSESMSENAAWSAEEVQTFLSIIGEEAVQRELNGAVRNEKVFQLVSAKMAESGFNRTASQCRMKLKKLRSDYRRIKDHNSQSGVAPKHWRWFEQMDAIYGHRPASMGRGAGVDPTTDLLESIITENDLGINMNDETAAMSASTSCASSPVRSSTSCHPPSPGPSFAGPTPSDQGVRRRTKGRYGRDQDLLDFLKIQHESEQRSRTEMQQRHEAHLELLMQEQREARQQEAEIMKQQMEQTASFNQAFLMTLGQLVQAISGCQEPRP